MLQYFTLGQIDTTHGERAWAAPGAPTMELLPLIIMCYVLFIILGHNKLLSSIPWGAEYEVGGGDTDPCDPSHTCWFPGLNHVLENTGHTGNAELEISPCYMVQTAEHGRRFLHNDEGSSTAQGLGKVE